ncbi:SDR family oxidoreductase [Pedobacter africanus]|uniref:UDP-N-acetylglucosamine 4-epimerase n=1 Tax=Pedobacter africanus TaxID=151894 RepID=A0A1W2BSV5_9SPHI|nr:SDR family oxidoreductase [Pedobacter africanus]SMC75816.1 UDP-N-acetylglucosamine 4-epimerase [Pedobacter africanus]
MGIELNKIKENSFLITGGAGFIGSNLVEFLLSHNARKVRVLDNFSNGHRKNIASFISNPAFEIIEGDIRNLETCCEACIDIDFVSHQAALGSVPRSINDPITTNEVNINGFLNMLIAIKDSNVKRMVYAASSSTYGDSKSLPKVESIIGNPLSPYAVTKYVNELYAHVFALNYGVETIGLRYFNVFGPKQDPNGAYAAVIPLFVQAILDNQSPFINGDGEQTRDFTYVDNAVQANVNAMLSDNSEATNQIYNIAVGDRTSLNQMFEILKGVENRDIVAIYREGRKGDVRDSLADISKAADLLEYKPQVKFKDGLVKTYNWYKNNQGFVRS